MSFLNLQGNVPAPLSPSSEGGYQADKGTTELVKLVKLPTLFLGSIFGEIALSTAVYKSSSLKGLRM